MPLKNKISIILSFFCLMLPIYAENDNSFMLRGFTSGITYLASSIPLPTFIMLIAAVTLYLADKIFNTNENSNQ